MPDLIAAAASAAAAGAGYASVLVDGAVVAVEKNEERPALYRAQAAALAGDHADWMPDRIAVGVGTTAAELVDPVYVPITGRRSFLRADGRHAVEYLASVAAGALEGLEIRQRALIAADGEICSILASGLVVPDNYISLTLRWEVVF